MAASRASPLKMEPIGLVERPLLPVLYAFLSVVQYAAVFLCVGLLLSGSQEWRINQRVGWRWRR